MSRFHVLKIAITWALTVSLVACGGGGGSTGGNTNPTPANTAPIANDDSVFTIDSLDGILINVLENDSDPDGDTITLQSFSESTAGATLSIEGSAIRYIAPANFSGDDSFSYTINDGNGGQASATVNVTVQQPVFNLSGNISPPNVVAVDSDTNDPNAEYVSNDTINIAQAIPNPVTMGGYINRPNSGATGRSRVSGDLDDYFRIELLAGQIITMLVSDFQTGDADLYLFDSGGFFVDASLETGQIESLVVPSDGTYFVNPYAYDGASNYVLIIGNTQIMALPGSSRVSNQFVPGEAVVRYTPNDAQKMDSGISPMMMQLGFSLRAGTVDRDMLLNLNPQAASLKIDLMKKDNRTIGPKIVSFRTDLDRTKYETLNAIKALKKEPGIAYAEPNYILKTFATPNDEGYVVQWHYPLINLPAAWDLTTGISDVIVAVIDTGVLLNHPDMQGQLVQGYDFIRDTQVSLDGDGIDPNPDDPGDSSQGVTPSSFHGTHVSGTVAAATNNTIGVAGIAWNSKVMPLRVLGEGGGTSYDINQAVLYAAGLPNDSNTIPVQRADIINLSLGGGGFSQADQNTFTAARQAGVIIVAAAGNESSSQLAYPASYDGVISVSAVDAERKRAPYSNFGAAIDVAAPGGDNQSDLNADGYPDGVLSLGGDDSSGSISFNYPFLNGTSMASPHMAGVVALMKSVNNALTPNDIDILLAQGALTDDLGSAGRDDIFGYGLINAQKAVIAALDAAGNPPADNPFLTVSPAALNFDSGTTSIQITLQNSGGGSLQLTSLTANTPWITTTTINTDADNLGSFLVTVDRSNLSNGLYSGQIMAQSTNNVVTLSVVMSVGTVGINNAVGYIYVLLVDTNTNDVVEQAEPIVANGAYAYAFSDIAAGAYRILAGTDTDNDTFICDAGEACGAYPTIDQLVQIDLNSDVSNLDFPIGYVVALPSTMSDDGETGGEPQGFSRSNTDKQKSGGR